MKTILKPLKNESAIECLERAAGWLNYNSETVLKTIPTVEGCLEFFNLISNIYEVTTFEEVLECIEEGESKKPLQEFLKKYKIKLDI